MRPTHRFCTPRPPAAGVLLLNKAEVAYLCGVSVSTVERWMAAGALRSVQARPLRFKRSEIEGWIERGCKVPFTARRGK